MFEFKDNFLMGQKSKIENGECNASICSASNVAEEQLAELARAVGGGTSPVKAIDGEGITLVDNAPALEFDLEGELSKAFSTEQLPVEPQPVRDTAAIETAFSKPVESLPEVQSELGVDFSDMIGAELERALEEEVAADAALGQTLSAPPLPVETLTPWDTPEILEAPSVPQTLEQNIQETVQQSFDAPQMADFEEPMRDYSDPIAEFVTHQDHGHVEASVQMDAATDTSGLHIDAVLGGAAALGLAAAARDNQEIPPQPEFTNFDPASASVDVPALDAQGAQNDFHDDSILIPEPHMLPPAGGRGRSGRRTALAIVAVAVLGGGAVLAWNTSSVDNGVAPTILASSEAVKEKPKNAGGKIVPNQDLAVYKTTKDAKSKAPKQKRLTDKTEKPITVAATSPVAKGAARVAPADKTTTGGLLLKPRRVRTVVVRPDGTIITATKTATGADTFASPVLALKPKIAPVTTQKVAAKPRSTKVSYKAPQAATAKVQVQPVKAAPKPVKIAKLAPAPTKVKPVAVKPVKKVVKKPAKKVVVKKAATSVPRVSSPYAVQIASQRSPAAAKQSYKKLARRYASVLKGKGVDIRKGVIKGKGTYYRVRIPAKSKAAAAKICRSLKAKGGACFVTR